MTTVTRRTFLKTTAAIAAASYIPPALAADPGSTVVVVHGKDVAAMLALGIAELGGWEKFIVAGKKATIKPNAAWASLPEQGGNTAPELVAAGIKACLKAGASEVVLPENPCSSPDESFTMSGIGAAAKAAGGKLYALREDRYFQKVELPLGKELKEAEVARDVLETGCLINMPVAKSHGGATLTLSMKNWMGAVKDRGFWHKNGLHQCIADCSTLIKPNLIIIDATRIMLENGPRGPGPLEHPGQIILSRDPVAADAYAATLFKKSPFDIPHIKLAHEMKLGCGVLEEVTIRHLEA